MLPGYKSGTPPVPPSGRAAVSQALKLAEKDTLASAKKPATIQGLIEKTAAFLLGFLRLLRQSGHISLFCNRGQILNDRAIGPKHVARCSAFQSRRR